MKKVQLDFMVVPELLATLAEVPDAVRVKIIDPEAIFLTGLLGESGKKLVNAGIEFYFTRSLAEKLINKQIAEEVKNQYKMVDGSRRRIYTKEEQQRLVDRNQDIVIHRDGYIISESAGH